MPPSAEAVKRAATRKRKAEAKTRIKAAPETEAGTRAETEGAQRVAIKEAEAPCKAAKAKKTERAEGSRKRARSSSPTQIPSAQRSRVEQGTPIDLTADTPPERPATEAQILSPVEAQSPPIIEGQPAQPLADEGTGPSTPAVGLPSMGAGVGLEKMVPPERAPKTTEVEEEVGSQSLPFRSVLENHGKWAERLMSQVCTPELKRGLKERGSSSFFRDAFVAHLWTVNSLTVLKEVLTDAEVSLGNSNNEAETARARAAEMTRELEEIRAAWDRDQARADNAEQLLEIARADAQLRLERAEKAEQALEEARGVADRESKKAADAEEQMKQKEAELFSCQLQLHTVTILKTGFEERVENAEEIARDSDARVAEMEGMLKTAQEQAEAAQEQAEMAKKKEIEAVDIFRKSAAYEEELADSTAFAYNLGFQECKAKVKHVFGLAEVDSLEPDDVEDQLDSAPAPGDATPSEP